MVNGLHLYSAFIDLMATKALYILPCTSLELRYKKVLNNGWKTRVIWFITTAVEKTTYTTLICVNGQPVLKDVC